MKKICRSCKEPKNATVRIFGKDKLQPDGIATICKVCRRIETSALRKKGSRETRMLDKIAPDTVRKLSMNCKKCGYATRAVYINMSEYEKMKNKFFCAQCLEKASSDEMLFDAVECKIRSIGEIRPSELPLMSS